MENKFELEVSTSTLLNLNKEWIGKMVKQATTSVLDGWSDPIQMLVTAKKIQEIGKQLETEIRPIAESKQNVGKSGVTVYGCEITESMNGVKYDFSACNDSEWNTLNAEMTTIKNKMTEREKFLKTLTKPIADAETGEVINPPIKTGKLGLNIKLM